LNFRLSWKNPNLLQFNFGVLSYTMWYQIISYLRFALKATNQHGVHSPFVFELITKCFYDKTRYPEYKTLTNHRTALLKDNTIIDVTDFGQGSRVFSSNKRPVSKIAKYAGITKKRQQLLYRLIRYLNPDHILELGTSVGLATASLGLGAQKGSVISIEGCPNTGSIAEHYFKKFGISNVQVHRSSFRNYFKFSDNFHADFVYIDGDHNEESTLEYFHTLVENVTNTSVFIFDDIYWSPQMTNAWLKICNHPKVTVSIDTYNWGFVFFRKEQQKQHFKIRM